MSDTVPDERSIDVAVPATPDAIWEALEASLSSVPFQRIELMEALFVGTTYTSPTPVSTVMFPPLLPSEKVPPVPVVGQALVLPPESPPASVAPPPVPSDAASCAAPEDEPVVASGTADPLSAEELAPDEPEPAPELAPDDPEPAPELAPPPDDEPAEPSSEGVEGFDADPAGEAPPPEPHAVNAMAAT
jgi:hypothetical protein